YTAIVGNIPTISNLATATKNYERSRYGLKMISWCAGMAAANTTASPLSGLIAALRAKTKTRVPPKLMGRTALHQGGLQPHRFLLLPRPCPTRLMIHKTPRIPRLFPRPRKIKHPQVKNKPLNHSLSLLVSTDSTLQN